MNSFILTVGLNHTTAPIPVREKIASASCLREDALGQLQSRLATGRFSESLVLSTCNRTEIYALTSDCAEGHQILRSIFSGQETFSTPPNDYLYDYSDRDAVAHLFTVSTGLDSMVVGEFEILGQVRDAYLGAARNKTIGPIFHRLFKDAIHVGKRARTETAIGTGATSAAYAAVALARQSLGSLVGRHILVIGTGEMGRRAARNLVDNGASMVVVANRTLDRAAELAQELRGRAVQFDQLPDALADADLVISATAAPHIILSASMIQKAMNTRPERPLCVLDIALPRDVDPEAAQIPNVSLFNVDDLGDLVDTNRSIREEAVADVRAIISQEVEAYWHWYLGRRAAPLLADLHNRSEAIREAELNKALRRLGHLELSERDRNVIAALSSALVSKILAGPTSHVKDHVQNGDGQLYLEVMRELFDLDGLPQSNQSVEHRPGPQ